MASLTHPNVCTPEKGLGIYENTYCFVILYLAISIKTNSINIQIEIRQESYDTELRQHSITTQAGKPTF